MTDHSTSRLSFACPHTHTYTHSRTHTHTHSKITHTARSPVWTSSNRFSSALWIKGKQHIKPPQVQRYRADKTAKSCDKWIHCEPCSIIHNTYIHCILYISVSAALLHESYLCFNMKYRTVLNINKQAIYLGIQTLFKQTGSQLWNMIVFLLWNSKLNG